MTAVGKAFQNSEGWTEVPYPPTDGMYFISTSGSDANDGKDPNGFGLTDAVYTHSTRTLTKASAFTSYTHTGGDRTDVIYIDSATGGISQGWYVIESKTDNDNIVLETASGLTADATVVVSSTGPKQTLAAGHALLTDGASDDQLLLKRGDTWTDEEIDIGSQRELTGSASGPILISNYGPLTDSRPIIKPDDTSAQKGIWLTSFATFNHIYIIGIEITPNNKSISATNSNIAIAASGTSSDILIEDVYSHLGGYNIKVEGTSSYDIPNVTIRRCGIFDAWSDEDHSQGVFTKYIDGLLVEECLCDKNGWDNSGTTQDSPYNHTMYLSDGTKNLTVRDNILGRASLNGVKLDVFDTTAYVYRNLIPKSRYIGQIGVGDENGENGNSIGNRIYFCNNVCEGFHNGIHVTNVADCYVRDNIVGPRGLLGLGKSQHAVKFTETSASPGYGFNNMDMSRNILYDARGPVNCDGLGVGTYGQWANVTISDNDHIEPNTDKAFRQIDSGLDITFSNNNYYSANTGDPANRFDVDGTKQSVAWWQSNYEATATNVNTDYPDPGRTVEDYAQQVLGLADYDAIVTAWKAERRGNWNEANQSRAISRWIEQGYNRRLQSLPIAAGAIA